MRCHTSGKLWMTKCRSTCPTEHRGREEGSFSGQPFQDTDVSKWLESASYALRLSAEGIDPSELESKVDEAVALFEEAQDDDGYLDTKFELDLTPEQRFKGLRWSHELYTRGHFI